MNKKVKRTSFNLMTHLLFLALFLIIIKILKVNKGYSVYWLKDKSYTTTFFSI